MQASGAAGSESEHKPKSTHGFTAGPPGQSELLWHSWMVLVLRQVDRKQGPPSSPQSDCFLQLNDLTPGLSSGKNCMPSNRSLSRVSERKPRSARCTESHLVRMLPVDSSLEPELSSIIY